MFHYRCDRCGRSCGDDEIRIVSNEWLRDHFSCRSDLNIGFICPGCIAFLEKHPNGR